MRSLRSLAQDVAEDVRDARHVCNSLERAIAKEFGIDEKRMQMRNSAVKSLNCMMKMCAEGRKRCSGDGMRVYKKRLLHSEYCICGNCIMHCMHPAMRVV